MRASACLWWCRAESAGHPLSALRRFPTHAICGHAHADAVDDADCRHGAIKVARPQRRQAQVQHLCKGLVHGQHCLQVVRQLVRFRCQCVERRCEVVGRAAHASEATSGAGAELDSIGPGKEIKESVVHRAYHVSLSIAKLTGHGATVR